MKPQNLAVQLVIIVVTVLATHYLWPLKSTAPLPHKNPEQVGKLTAPVFPPTIPKSPLPAAQAPITTTTKTTWPMQAPNPSTPMTTHPGSTPFPVMTPELRARLEKAHAAVLATNPALKAEDDDLKKQSTAMTKSGSTATPQDRFALMAKWRDHTQKIRTAMADADPSLQSFFADVDAATKARMAQFPQQRARLTPASGVPNSTTPSSNPPSTSSPNLPH